MTLDKFDELKSKIKYIQLHCKHRDFFGSDYHSYKFNDCLSSEKITKFEEQHNVSLPNDYRRFINEIGNGGFGPGYGLMELGYQNSILRSLNYSKYIATPFPHTDAWNENFENIDFDTDTTDEEYQNQLAGSIPIAIMGCGYDEYLVITGKESGNIWTDARVGDYGIAPIRDANNNHLDFFTWYDLWLDDVIKKYKR